MTYAESNFTGSAIAANNQAAFTFSYLDVTEIRVDITVGSTTTTYSTDSSPAGFTVVSPNQFVTLTSHPADTDAIRIYRVTNLDNTRATFVSGSAISANDLNNNYQQTLQAAQETRLEATRATSTADSATNTANAADTAANTAVSIANSATTTANEAREFASNAFTTADFAKDTAEAAETTALDASATVARFIHDGENPTGSGEGGEPRGLAFAVSTAENALEVASGATSTANEAKENAELALDNSRESDGSGGFVSAISRANTAVATADTATANVQTALSQVAASADAAATAAAQAEQASNDVTTAVNTANSAESTANSASTQALSATNLANDAITRANNAFTNAETAVNTADEAKNIAEAADSKADTAITNSSNAVNDANTALSTANTASQTANTASTTATNAINLVELFLHDGDNPTGSGEGDEPQGLAFAINTANTALQEATSARTTANTADANSTTALNNSRESDGSGGFVSAITRANEAVTTANAADGKADTAISTAQSAETTAENAVQTANDAVFAVSNAIFFTPVADVASIPQSPSNEERIEIIDPTGLESFSPLSGIPPEFVGSPELFVRIEYDETNATWVWKQYFADDPESRYAYSYLPVIKGDGTSNGQVGKITLNCSNNNHGVAIQSPPHEAGATYTLTLPRSLPTINGQSLTADTSGNLSFATIDAAFIETPQTITKNKVISSNINAGVMGPTVAIDDGIVITVGLNSELTVLS